MHISPVIELAIVAGFAVLAAVLLWLALRKRAEAAPPLIAASYVWLREGWYQIDMRVINRAPSALGGVSLRCLRPRRARLMAPVTSVSTKDYDFQVWSDPESDKPKKSIPLDFVAGPHEAAAGCGLARLGGPSHRVADPAGQAATGRIAAGAHAPRRREASSTATRSPPRRRSASPPRSISRATARQPMSRRQKP